VEEALSIVVVGASGDLARKKIYPALFALYCQNLLPSRFRIFGFARSSYGTDELRSMIAEHLTCRYTPGETCGPRMEAFLSACHYVRGAYDSADAFLDLYTCMREEEQGRPANRLFYLAVPPSVFLDVARSIGNAGLVSCGQDGPWSRVVVEKPFGRDRASSDELTRELAQIFTETQTFRIDHYLGKEVIQNLLVLRFANLIFEPLWCNRFVRNVDIEWMEDHDTRGREGYFDQYGIVRDVLQNHLLQILALMAMDPPARLSGTGIRDAKVKLLRQVRQVRLEDMAIGQFTAGTHRGRDVPGYTDDPAVPDASRTPTYAAAVLHVDNERWRGVPFLLTAGKGLHSRRTEIRVHFREVPDNRFCDASGCPEPNALIIRVQPDEGVYFRVTTKVPGLGMKLDTQKLDMQYEAAFEALIPEAYESLLLDVLQGEKGLFIRSDELEAAWDIFTPVLHEIEEQNLAPETYPFGSEGPAAAKALKEKVLAREGKEADTMTESACTSKDRHQGHLCVLVSEKRFDEIRALVRDPKFICWNCGRVADSEENLCNPMSLESGAPSQS